MTIKKLSKKITNSCLTNPLDILMICNNKFKPDK